MKTKSIWLWVLLLVTAISGCKYDDADLWNKVNSLDDRLTNIEEQLTQMNTNISSISTIVNAMDDNLFITSLEKTDNGYSIKFNNGETATLTNGKDGAAGKDAPVIGFGEFEGKYYWTQTIDGEQSWLTDEAGEKIPVTGADAVTPQLKVNTEGFWMISYDSGLTYTEMLDDAGNPVKAVGEDGKDGEDGVDGIDGSDGDNGDSWFSNVYVDDDKVVFVLQDGTEFSIPLLEEDVPEIDYNEFNIINNGEVKGAVDEVTDMEDSKPLAIVQTVPSISELMPDVSSVKTLAAPFLHSAKVTSREQQIGYVPTSTRAGENSVTFPANLPIMFFFDDKILLPSIKDNFVVTVDGVDVKGTITINASSTGNAIITFTPWDEFTVNVSISVTIKKGLKDDGGNEMLEDVILSYVTNEPGTGNFDGNENFENGNEGIYLIGDGNIMEGTTGDLCPSEGNRFVAISSGDYLVSEGRAIGDASSMMILGPIEKNIQNLSFSYDFISAEFNEWVGSPYDDCVIMTVYGPYGSYSELLTSVNIIGTENAQFKNYPNMPDTGDEYAGHIGWTTAEFTDFPNVGTPAYITFTVTDVSDHIYSTIFAIDNIQY